MVRLVLAHRAAANMQTDRAAKVSAIPIGAANQISRPNAIRYRIPIASIISEFIDPTPLCGLAPPCQKLDRACPCQSQIGVAGGCALLVAQAQRGFKALASDGGSATRAG